MPTVHSDLLAGLPDADVSDMVALASRVSLASGQVLFRLGNEASALYVVERGRIALTLPLHVGGREEDMLVEERSPGQALGWSALIAPYRFTLNASAPLETELLAFPREVLLAYFSTHPVVAYTVMGNVASVVGQRLQVFQAMWLREMQRVVELRCA